MALTFTPSPGGVFDTAARVCYTVSARLCAVGRRAALVSHLSI